MVVRDVEMLAIVLLLFASQTGEGADQNMTKAIAHDLIFKSTHRNEVLSLSIGISKSIIFHLTTCQLWPTLK